MVRILRRSIILIVLAVLTVALGAVPIASGGAEPGAGSLALYAELSVGGSPVACPPDAPPEADFCSQRSVNGRVPGLGFVTASPYLYLVDENPSPSCGGVRILHSKGQINVAGKGAIQFDLARLDQCVPDLLKANQPFTITGGSGAYAGAAGTGIVNHNVDHAGTGIMGTDTWSGSLEVPGHEFDLTPPTLSGLVNKTVRAPKRTNRIRVKYRVSARDLIDGSIPARCQPGTGSRFRVGRTVVKCSASDTSANTATGSFRVVVKRRR